MTKTTIFKDTFIINIQKECMISTKVLLSKSVLWLINTARDRGWYREWDWHNRLCVKISASEMRTYLSWCHALSFSRYRSSTK